MSSSNWASIIVRYNRSLRKKVRSGKSIFTKSTASLKRSSLVDSESSKRRYGQKRLIDKHKRSPKKGLVLQKGDYMMIICLLAFVIVGLSTALSFIGRIENRQLIENGVIGENINFNSKKASYDTFIELGYGEIAKNNPEYALSYFNKALDYRKYSKQAHFGIAKAYYTLCQDDGKNCEDAKGHIQYVLARKILSKSTISSFLHNGSSAPRTN